MFQIDERFLIDCFRELVEVPSPVGYDVQLRPVLERYAAQFGYSVTYDRRGTPYIELDGEDNSKTVLLGAHADTLGLMVRHIEADGKIRVRALGGINFSNIEGSTVTVYTRDGRSYTGLVVCNSHSVHVFLDEDVHSKEEVQALGIQNGDIIHIEPECEFTENGYLKSRFIDDKAAIACAFAMLKYLKENNRKPKYRTLLAFPYREEIGVGGRYVPEEVEEYIAIDIGLIGPQHEGNERKVSICAKDKNGPYDYELINRLIGYAEKAGVDYALDVFLNYSTDGNAAVRGGNNLKADGIVGTTKLMLAYALDI